MSARFFLTAPPHDGLATLQDDEARHLVRVVRAKIGDMIVVFDGTGCHWSARVSEIKRNKVLLDVEALPLDACVTAGPEVWLAIALPKGDRQKWMVEKLTELGVARLIPLQTLRGVAEATDNSQARMERVVIEACKQSGRNTLMDIAKSHSLSSLIESLPSGARLLIADPGGVPLAIDQAAIPAEQTLTPVVALIGPEGGFTQAELITADRAGARRVSLGSHLLRIETAAIALAAKLL